MLYKLTTRDNQVVELDAAQVAEVALNPIDEYYNLTAPYIEFAKICANENFPGVTLKFIAGTLLHYETLKMAMMCRDEHIVDHIYCDEGDFEALGFFYNYLAQRGLEEEIRERYIKTLCYDITIAIIDDYEIDDEYSVFCAECADDIGKQTWLLANQVGEIDITGLILFINLNYRLILQKELGEDVIPQKDIDYVRDAYEFRTVIAELIQQELVEQEKTVQGTIQRELAKQKNTKQGKVASTKQGEADVKRQKPKEKQEKSSPTEQNTNKVGWDEIYEQILNYAAQTESDEETAEWNAYRDQVINNLVSGARQPKQPIFENSYGYGYGGYGYGYW